MWRLVSAHSAAEVEAERRCQVEVSLVTARTPAPSPATLATATLTDWSHRNHQSAINVIIIIFHTRSGPGNVKTSDNMRALVPVLDIA